LNLVVCNYFVFCRDVVLGEDVGAESHSASQPGLGKPPSTPEMSAHEAEAMVDSMIRDSPLPNLERATDEIPEDGGSDKLQERDEGEKLPEGGNEK
jgi:hypothetical protein